MLKLRDIRQVDAWDCGRACYFCVCDYWRVQRPGKFWCGHPHTGTDPYSLDTHIKLTGLHTVIGRMTLLDLAYFTRTRPVICLITDAGGHYVTVRGVAEDRIHFVCPSKGFRSLKASTWVKRWRDLGRGAEKFDQLGIAVGK